MTLPPKPVSRPERVSLIDYVRRFRADILSAHPARLYRAKMAEFRTPFFHSFLVNEPALVRRVLQDRPGDFPKSARVRAGLGPLLGQSVFVTNGAEWERQRRIIDLAFEGGRLRDTFPAMVAAGEAAVTRLRPGIREIEAVTSHAAVDVIFRTLFSMPIEDRTAAAVFQAFRSHQRSQPLLNLAAFVAGPGWMPRLHGRQTRATARTIRGLIERLTQARAAAIAAGTAPDDLATKIMTMRDPETGQGFDGAEIVDQVVIFFLAGHETSASGLAWALYLLATHPEAQARVAAEAAALPERPDFSDMRRLAFTRDVFREALRLYPPVPMMVREATRAERFRDRDVPKGAQIILSPWYLHRHERLWDRPDAFDPDRFATPHGQASAREAFIPFSAGPRVCPGAGFAMVEGPLMLAMLVRAFAFAPVEGCTPVPVAHLTLRARRGIWLQLAHRAGRGPGT